MSAVQRPRKSPGQAAIDREKLRSALRQLRRDALLAILDEALDLIPASRLAKLTKGHFPVNRMRRDRDLVADVKTFCDASYGGKYYEDFCVNSKNFMEKSRGTETWIAECERLFARCVAEAGALPPERAREAVAMLIALLRYVDECHDDVVFWADEGGTWEVGIDWKAVLPVWFRCLAATAEPAEYVTQALGVIDDFVQYDRAAYLPKARGAATPEQRRALKSAGRRSPRSSPG